MPDDFDYNPHSGKRGDRSHRVELKRSSVEYIAPSEYMVSLDCERVYDLRMTMSDLSNLQLINNTKPLLTVEDFPLPLIYTVLILASIL